MCEVVFQTSDSKLVNNHTQVLCETFKQIIGAIIAYRLLELPPVITVSLRIEPFDDDSDELMSIGGCSVKHNLIEMRVPPCYDTKTFVTFCHELVHLHQGQLGWLREADDGGMLWFDKYFKLKENMTHDEYMSLPWEMMAFREQKDVWNTIKPHIVEYINEERECPEDSVEINVVN
jgi:hypothetical protein